MEDTRTEAEKEEARKRKLANLKTFRPVSELTEEERKEQDEIRAKGKQAIKEYHQRKKTLKEQAEVLLNTVLSREQLVKIVGDSAELIKDSDCTVQTALLISALREATENGNVKAMEFLRDTSGQRPKDVIDTNLNVMSDADKQLLEKVSKRLNVV